MNDKRKIHLLIDGNYYPVFIQMDDEEIVREAAKRLNQKLNTYRKRFPRQSIEQIFAMAAFDCSLEALREKERNDTVPFTNKIKELDEIVEMALNENE